MVMIARQMRKRTDDYTKGTTRYFEKENYKVEAQEPLNVKDDFERI